MKEIDELFFKTASEGNYEVVGFLLKNKCNINTQNEYGWTALMFAVYFNRRDIAKLLLEHPNIDINIRDKEGKTALDIATDYSRRNIEKILVEHGATYS